MQRLYMTISMRITTLISLILIVGTTQGCAALGLEDQPEGPDLANDPVARAAMAFRTPAAGNDPSSASDQSPELTLGMSMRRVRGLWGEPQEVETSGDSPQGNQRWIYFEGLSSRYSMRTSRVVYFEQGYVAGWESARR